MANFFDQFDQEKPPAQRGASNFFDQFDERASSPNPPLLEEKPYKPLILPIKRVDPGEGILGSSVGYQPSELIESIGRAFTAPTRALDPNQEFDPVSEAQNFAAAFSGGGVASRAARPAIEAGGIAMNAVGPPVKKGAQAVSRAASVIAQPLIDRFDETGAMGRVLAKRLMQDNPGMTLEQAMAKAQADLASKGPQATMADTGEAMSRLNRNLTQGPGETAQRAKDILGGRQAAEKTRMIESLKQNVSPRLFYDVNAEAENAMKAASPHFRAAFKANPVVESRIIDRLLLTPAGRDAMNFARRRVQNRMDKMAKPDPELTGQLNDLVARGEAAPIPGGVARGLKMETLDLIRQDLYDQMQLAKKKYYKGDIRKGEYDEVRDIYSEFRQALIDADVTGRAGPNSRRAAGGEYEKGLAKFRDAAKLQEALEDGRSFVRGDPELLDVSFDKLSPREKDAYRAGVVKEAVEMIGRDTSDLTPAQIMAAIKAESSVRKKLATIVPTQAQFDNLMKDIENNLRFRETNRMARGGSPTGSIMMEEGQIAADNLATAGGIVKDAARGNLPGATAKLVEWASSQLRKLQMPQRTRDRLGEMLLSQDPKVQQQAFDLIKNAGQNGWVYAP